MRLKTKISIGVLLTFALLTVLAMSTRAQGCGLRVTGAIANCSGSSVLWSSSTPGVSGYYLQTYAGRFPSGQSLLPVGTRSFLIPSGCGSGGAVRLVEVLTTGATCTLDWTGNLPHARPCDQCGTNGGGNGTTIVSSANFRGSVSRNSLASIFPDPGVTFTDQSQFATSLPLPTSLAGVTVEIEGQLCELIAVTPGQINFYLPAWLDPGPTETAATIRSTRGSVAQFFGRPQLNPSAPGVFTLAANGTGQAASNWLVIKPNGLQVWQLPGALSFNSQDRIFLVLYATGVNEQLAQVFINNTSYSSTYCGDTWMPGVQQIVFEIPQPHFGSWPSIAGAYVRVGVPGRSWDSQGFDVRR